MGCPVKGFRQLYKILRRPAGSSAHQCNRSHRDTLIHNGNPVLHGNLFPCLHQVFCHSGNLLIYLPAALLQITVRTVQKADPHRDRPNVQILFLYHLIGLIDLKHIYHGCSPLSLNAVHFIENVLVLTADHHADFLAQTL